MVIAGPGPVEMLRVWSPAAVRRLESLGVDAAQVEPQHCSATAATHGAESSPRHESTTRAP